MWLITGLVMTFNGLLPTPARVRRSEPIQPDYQEVTMSPADAIAHLEETLGQSVEVNSVSFRQIREILVYHIALENGASHLIETQSGQEVKITPEFAREIAYNNFPTPASILQIVRLDDHDLGYFFGPLPIYRVIFDDSRSTYVHVSMETGEVVRRNDRWQRLRGAFELVHTFQVFKIISGRERPITALLWLLSFIATLAALIGYYLALPHRWRVF